MEHEISKPEKPKKNQQRTNLKDYARYSSLAFEMIAIIMAGVLGGLYIDSLLKWKFPVFTLFLTILFLGLAIYVAIKDFIHPK